MDLDNGFFSQYKQQFIQYRDSLQKMSYQDCYIQSRDNLKLHARFYQSDNAKRIVVCAHGYKGSGEFDFGCFIANMYQQCNLLVIDQRTCGLSEGRYITFGAKEHLDIIDWVDYINKANSNLLPIYLYGVSLGGSSVALCSDYDFKGCVHGIIDDCGYSSMKQIFLDVGKTMIHIPVNLLVYFINIWCHLEGKFDMNQADCKVALNHNLAPVLFIHGNGDDFVTIKHGRMNYDSCSKSKDLLIIENAGHAVSIYQDSDTYFNKVNDFFKKWD